ncbi:hypothetical protein GC207_11575 [bacterium]|nr:hypothetical protein [bacterium]
MGIFGEILGSSFWWVATPAGLVLLALYALVKETQRKGRRPFSDNPLRPPGEYLRIRIEALNEKMLIRLMATVLVIIPVSVSAESISRGGNVPAAIAIVATGLAIALGLLLWTWRAVMEWRAYSLGFEGERAVGEELNRLMLDGCHVVHDLQMERRGNIDHVVVAPHAVYAVETKTWRKLGRDKVKDDHVLKFTGEALELPNGTDRKALAQARKNARALERKLTSEFGKEVAVKPVLAIPGWMIERTARGDVIVVNNKLTQLRDAIVDPRAVRMDDELRDLIIRKLDNWSRDSMDLIR